MIRGSLNVPKRYTGITYVIGSGNIYFLHMILVHSEQLAMNLGEIYLVTKQGNERSGKQKLDLVVLQLLILNCTNIFYYWNICTISTFSNLY